MLLGVSSSSSRKILWGESISFNSQTFFLQLQKEYYQCLDLFFSARQSLKKLCLKLLSFTNFKLSLNLFDMSWNKKVQRSQYCRSLYKTNKYQCDVRFYDQLLTQLAALQLWQSHRQIELLKHQVQSIKQLTVQHARSLDESPDQRHAQQLSSRLRTCLVNLNTKPVIPIVDCMNALEGRSMTKRVWEVLEEDDPGLAEGVIEKICSHIHNEKHRTESILKLGVLKLLNGHKMDKLASSYKGVIEKAMEELKGFKGLIRQIPEGGETEVLSSPKFAHFLEGTQLIYRATSKMYEALKVIDGQSNYKFKLNNLRTQINNTVLQFNMRFTKNVPIIEDCSAPQFSRPVLDWYIEFLLTRSPEMIEKIRSHLCFLCMGEDNLQASTGGKYAHAQCWNYMRYMTRR